MESDDEWKQKAIQRDMIETMRKLGKGKNTIIVLLYKIKSLGEDKRLKIEMDVDMYEWLAGRGVNFDDFSKGEKLFEGDREKFMNWIKAMRAKAEIVDKDFRIIIYDLKTKETKLKMKAKLEIKKLEILDR